MLSASNLSLFLVDNATNLLGIVEIYRELRRDGRSLEAKVDV